MQIDDAKARLRAADFIEVDGSPIWVNAGKNTAAMAMLVVRDGEWSIAFWNADAVVHE